MDYPKGGIHIPVLGQMYWLGTKTHEDKSENMKLQRKEMVSGFFDCDNTEYNGILDSLGAGIYICATVHWMEMMCSGGTSSRIVMSLVDCSIVDSDSDSEIEAYLENCGA